MMTPMKRLRVKNEPKMMKQTKYRYMYRFSSYIGWDSTYNAVTMVTRDKSES